MNTTQTKHTALPWRIASSAEIWAYDQPILTIAHEENSNLPADVANANQAFIVRACNSHYELLEACKATMEEFEDRYDGSPDGGYKWMGILMHQLQAAIAQAEKGEQQ